jgi:Arc/MetJ family transcription regulator
MMERDVHIQISDELRAFAEEQAKRLGLKGTSEYIQAILREKVNEANGSHERTSGGQEPEEDLFAFMDRLAASIPEEDLKKIPTDLAKNVDHYLYGAPKEDE